ncbi:MAG TPA: M48 family metalloprotease [Candidatus Angelobacter sp.]|nr:M48 family metalloprotease [Candidatus Angelobacter sp.]
MGPVPDAASPSRPFVLRDPETFYKAQKRNRHATWRMSLLCLIAALLMGIPLTLVLTPLFYAGTMVVAEIVNYFSPLPPEFWQNVNSLGQLAVKVGDYVINQKGTLDPQTLAFGLGLILLPGIVIALVLWIGVLALFRRGGVGGTLMSLNAREPDKNDLKELQLVDVVEEMAIAAGLLPPKVMLIDSPGANAAAVGTSPADARLVVSRRLLDDLNRDQLEGLLGQLIGSIGNGDLRVAFMVTSVFETCGLLVTLINSPFGRESRGVLWRILRYGFSRSSSQAAQAAEAEAVASLLSRSLEMGQGDIDRFFDSAEKKKSFWRKFLTFIFFPILFTNLAIELTLWFFLNILLGPCMALVWRTRRYLADASAVQLTRNPDALATALQRLSQDNTAIPGSVWASHLFVMNPKGDSSMSKGLQPTTDQKQRMLLAWESTRLAGAPQSTLRPPGTPPTEADFARGMAEFRQTQLAAMRGDAQAINRLMVVGKAMGAFTGDIPNPADIIAAQRGDQAAIARLRARHEEKPHLQTTGLQAQSMLSFHPPLKRRLRRLDRMGAHVEVATRKMGFGATLVMLVLWMIIGPLLLVAGGAMLVAIAMIIMLNLMFLGLWLMVIHGIFWWLGHR